MKAADVKKGMVVFHLPSKQFGKVRSSKPSETFVDIAIGNYSSCVFVGRLRALTPREKGETK